MSTIVIKCLAAQTAALPSLDSPESTVSLIDKPVTFAVDRQNVFRLCRVFFELVPESEDVVVHGPGGWIHLVAPDLIQQLFASHDFSLMENQKAQDFIFFGRQFQQLALSSGYVPIKVDLYLTETVSR